MQYQRLQKRNGLAPRQIDQILRAQLSREIRLASADDVIDNSKDLDALTHQVSISCMNFISVSFRMFSCIRQDIELKHFISEQRIGCGCFSHQYESNFV
ncbi:MAG: dephospho-CoA kinase [Thiotrichaceae bacterium]